MVSDAKGAMDGRALRATLGVLAIAGFSISLYLTWVHLAGVEPVCVAGGDGCQVVQSSRYAAVLGVPVPMLGLAGYASLLVAAGLRGGAGAYLGLLVALVGTLFSAYLTYLEIFVIGAVCKWCVTSAAIMAVALLCASLRVTGPPTENRSNGLDTRQPRP